MPTQAPGISSALRNSASRLNSLCISLSAFMAPSPSMSVGDMVPNNVSQCQLISGVHYSKSLATVTRQKDRSIFRRNDVIIYFFKKHRRLGWQPVPLPGEAIQSEELLHGLP